MKCCIKDKAKKNINCHLLLPFKDFPGVLEPVAHLLPLEVLHNVLQKRQSVLNIDGMSSSIFFLSILDINQ